MQWVSRDQYEIDTTGSKRFTRALLFVFGISALIGLSIGVVWVAAGLISFGHIW